jgi:hypothetical protein
VKQIKCPLKYLVWKTLVKRSTCAPFTLEMGRTYKIVSNSMSFSDKLQLVITDQDHNFCQSSQNLAAQVKLDFRPPH